MKTMRSFVLVAAALALCGTAQATEGLRHLVGQEAMDHVGNPKARFTGGGYTYEILKRSHRDAMNGRFSDGVILSRQTNRFYYAHRSDGDATVILGRADGREEDPVTADAIVWNPLWNAISDDNPDAHVFLDAAGNELAIIYVGHRTDVKASLTAEGLLEVEISSLYASSARAKMRSYGR